jgi:hypothetical protein
VWLVRKETALIADKAKLVDTVPSIAPSIQHTLMGGSARKTDQPKNEVPSHTEVMQQLSNLLGVPYQDVFSGDAVESALVRAAGIMASQTNARYRRKLDGSTCFHLNFASLLEYKQFLNYYQENHSRLIINHGEFNQGRLCEIYVNTNALLLCIKNLNYEPIKFIV